MFKQKESVTEQEIQTLESILSANSVTRKKTTSLPLSSTILADFFIDNLSDERIQNYVKEGMDVKSMIIADYCLTFGGSFRNAKSFWRAEGKKKFEYLEKEFDLDKTFQDNSDLIFKRGIEENIAATQFVNLIQNKSLLRLIDKSSTKNDLKSILISDLMYSYLGSVKKHIVGNGYLPQEVLSEFFSLHNAEDKFSKFREDVLTIESYISEFPNLFTVPSDKNIKQLKSIQTSLDKIEKRNLSEKNKYLDDKKYEVLEILEKARNNYDLRFAYLFSEVIGWVDQRNRSEDPCKDLDDLTIWKFKFETANKFNKAFNKNDEEFDDSFKGFNVVYEICKTAVDSKTTLDHHIDEIKKIEIQIKKAATDESIKDNLLQDYLSNKYYFNKLADFSDGTSRSPQYSSYEKIRFGNYTLRTVLTETQNLLEKNIIAPEKQSCDKTLSLANNFFNIFSENSADETLDDFLGADLNSINRVMSNCKIAKNKYELMDLDSTKFNTIINSLSRQKQFVECARGFKKQIDSELEQLNSYEEIIQPLKAATFNADVLQKVNSLKGWLKNVTKDRFESSFDLSSRYPLLYNHAGDNLAKLKSLESTIQMDILDKAKLVADKKLKSVDTKLKITGDLNADRNYALSQINRLNQVKNIYSLLKTSANDLNTKESALTKNINFYSNTQSRIAKFKTFETRLVHNSLLPKKDLTNSKLKSILKDLKNNEGVGSSYLADAKPKDSPYLESLAKSVNDIMVSVKARCFSLLDSTLDNHLQWHDQYSVKIQEYKFNKNAGFANKFKQFSTSWKFTDSLSSYDSTIKKCNQQLFELSSILKYAEPHHKTKLNIAINNYSRLRKQIKSCSSEHNKYLAKFAGASAGAGGAGAGIIYALSMLF
ncbi:hypothetical protein HOK51_02150 [Candidatus Woesearchaeota archaeon]|jgi:hypothetical protein|nr:hypothetical protein [Candidatus Woesearchaeota archaeon]MBT6518618.1 hypothetical protein [Candidatus Woesearchaeota archaeon]MBT7368742.1 hypothetical protein [Candidatus Woesearchaeota archaeon]